MNTWEKIQMIRSLPYLTNLINKTKSLPKIISVNFNNIKHIKKNIYNSNFYNENNLQNLSFVLEISKHLKLIWNHQLLFPDLVFYIFFVLMKLNILFLF